MSDDQELRQPKNLQGLLRLAAANQEENVSEERNYEHMSEERRQWLNDVVASMSTNYIKVMNENIQILLDGIEKRKTVDEDEESISLQEATIENIIDIVDNLDNANDFHKIGGFGIIVSLLNTSRELYAGIRWRTAGLLAVLTQNNPYCQDVAIHENNGSIIKLLLSILEDSDGGPMVKVKCVHALSCITRGHADAQKRFEAADGFSFLIKALQSDIQKLRIKTCFMLTAYFDENDSAKDCLLNMGFVELLVKLLHAEHNPTHEHLLSALLSFVNDYDKSLTECRRQELNLHKVLSEKIKSLKGMEEYLEEVEYSEKLLQKCFPNQDATER